MNTSYILTIGILVIVFEAVAGIASNVLANYLQGWFEGHPKFGRFSQAQRLRIAATIFISSQLFLILFLILLSNSSLERMVEIEGSSVPLPTYTFGPTPTPDAYEVQIEDLISPDLKVLKKTIENLDGAGPDEIIIRYEDTSIENSVSSASLDELEEQMGVMVFSFSQVDGWRPVLKLPRLGDGCGFYSGDYGVVSLFPGASKQVVVWLNCGTGAFLSFEIYQYRGLGFLERIYKNETWDSTTGEPDSRWLESGIYITDDYQLFISHPHGLYQYMWDGENLVATENSVDLGPNGLTVEYWISSDGSLHVSQENITLKVGQYLYLKQIAGGNYPEDTRIQFSNMDVLKIQTPTIYFAENEGATDIYLRPWHDKPMITLTVIAR